MRSMSFFFVIEHSEMRQSLYLDVFHRVAEFVRHFLVRLHFLFKNLDF